MFETDVNGEDGFWQTQAMNLVNAPHSIDRLHGSLFEAIAGFLDYQTSPKNWQEYPSARLFGGRGKTENSDLLSG